MRKLATLLVIGAIAFTWSCGPSAQELAQKRIDDSIRIADSTAREQAKIDSAQAAAAKEAALKAHNDSITEGWLDDKGAPTKKLTDAIKKAEKEKAAAEKKAAAEAKKEAAKKK